MLTFSQFITEIDLRYVESGYIAPDGDVLEGSHGSVIAQLLGKLGGEPTKNIEELGFVRFLLTRTGDFSASCKVGGEAKHLQYLIRMLGKYRYHKIDQIHIDMQPYFEFSSSGPTVVNDAIRAMNSKIHFQEEHINHYWDWGWVSPRGKVIYGTGTKYEIHDQLLAKLHVTKSKAKSDHWIRWMVVHPGTLYLTIMDDGKNNNFKNALSNIKNFMQGYSWVHKVVFEIEDGPSYETDSTVKLHRDLSQISKQLEG